MFSHRIRIARDGLDGLEKVVEEIPDVILLDVEMPFLDGPGMARELARRSTSHSAIPIILVSGSVNLTAIAARARISHVLRKPFAPDAVLSLLARVLGSGRTPS